MITIKLNGRLDKIVEIVKRNEPITGEEIASLLNITRAAIRPDLKMLTMIGILGARPKVGYYYIGNDEKALISKQLKERKVKEIMSVPILVTEDTTVYNTIVTMFLEDVGSIFISNKGYLAGIVSRKDMLKSAIGGGDINRLPVSMAMTRMPNVIVAYPDDSVILAARKIIEHEIDSLPVVKMELNEGREYYTVIGRITKTNITRFFVDLAGE